MENSISLKDLAASLPSLNNFFRLPVKQTKCPREGNSATEEENNEHSKELTSNSISEIDLENSNAFTCFPSLPVELRRKIWGHACDPSLVPLNIRIGDNFISRDETYFYFVPANGGNRSSITQTSFEAREVAQGENSHPAFTASWRGLKYGSPNDFPVTRPHGPGIMLSPKDILYFRLDDISTRSDGTYCRSKGHLRRYDTKFWLSGLDLDLDAITNVTIAFDIDVLTEANNLLYAFIWIHRVDEILLIDNTQQSIPVDTKGNFKLKDYDECHAYYDSNTGGIFISFLTYLEHKILPNLRDPPGHWNLHGTFGAHRKEISREEFKMPKFKRVSIVKE